MADKSEEGESCIDLALAFSGQRIHLDIYDHNHANHSWHWTWNSVSQASIRLNISFQRIMKETENLVNDQINQLLTDQCLYWMLIKRSVESFAFLQTLDNAFLMQLRKINEKEERKQSIYRVQWDVEKKKKFIWLVNIIRNLEEKKICWYRWSYIVLRKVRFSVQTK